MKYEYFIIQQKSAESFEIEASKLSAEGWRICGFSAVYIPHKDRLTYTGVFERKINNGPVPENLKKHI